MNSRLFLSLLGLVLVTSAGAEENLVPNPQFTAKTPLESWRVDFPYEGFYVENVKYLRVVPDSTKGSCVVIDLPPGIAGNQGGKIESAFIKAEPGATYRVQVDCKTGDFSAKVHAEAWTTDPKPIDKPDKFRVPARDGHPPLVMCYRAQLPDPPARSQQWSTVQREFTLPKTVTVAGKTQAPEYLSLKAVVYEGTQAAGKSYFTNFRLIRVKGPTP